MTAELLIRPEDSGEIPLADPGADTRNLLPYVDLPPAMRRPTVEIPLLAVEPRQEPAAVLELIGGCQRIVPNDEDFGTGPGPDPTPPFPPPPPPPTPSSATYVRPARRPFAYAGRHRPGWHGAWRRFLADVTAPLGRAL